MKRNQPRTDIGWYVTFALLAVGIFVVVGYFTDLDAIGAGVGLAWNALALLVNALIRLLGGLLLILAKGIGWRRLGRLGTAIMGVGLGYAGSVILSDEAVRKAHGRREKLKAAITRLRNRWQGLHLGWKLAIVAVLIATQVYVHSLLIIFPIAFLVPVVRRLWVRVADWLFGSWYWRTFGGWHRAAVGSLAEMPVLRQAIGAGRLVRIRYLCAWRLWRHDPRYRCAGSRERQVSLIEPARLWWRGELDRYVGRPLLSGRPGALAAPLSTGAERPPDPAGSP
jgi:hypothetical protein